MMLLGFKEFFNDRISVIGINIRNTYLKDTAYFFNNWASFFSALFFELTFILFVNILYSKVDLFAGYTRAEMLFFMILAEISFVFLFGISYDNLSNMILDVNKGSMDLILVKPLPHLFYFSVRDISFISLLRDFLVPIGIIGMIVPWHQIHTTPLLILIGFICFILSLIVGHTIQFIAAMPVFWFGESSNLFNTVYALYDVDIPLEGYGYKLKVAFTTILPILITAPLTTSVILGKSNPINMLLLTLCLVIIALILRYELWQSALRHYTSASS